MIIKNKYFIGQSAIPIKKEREKINCPNCRGRGVLNVRLKLRTYFVKCQFCESGLIINDCLDLKFILSNIVMIRAIAFYDDERIRYECLDMYSGHTCYFLENEIFADRNLAKKACDNLNKGEKHERQRI